MKLRNISCSQFAGVCDMSVSLSDGINVIYGKNESGKSTLVSLISRTLFQNPHIDKRSDKAFCDLYYPSEKRGNAIGGDFADGKLTFEYNGERYILSKEWTENPLYRLKTPNGIISDKEKIDNILSEILVYGEGVYSDMLFSSQYNTGLSLKTLLDSAKKSDMKDELTSAISLAFAESDGIPVEKIETAIKEKIDGLAGKHWDIAACKPMKKTGSGRWSQGIGEVLKAYYALCDAEEVINTINEYESDIDVKSAAYKAAAKLSDTAEKTLSDFKKYSGELTVKQERLKSEKRLSADIAEMEKNLTAWPNVLSELETAKSLKTECASRELLDRYNMAKSAYEDLKTLEGSVSAINPPSDDEIAFVKKAQREISALKNELCGMNLSAVIKMLGDNKAEIRRVTTGELIDISEGVVSINEAVDIVIPDVMVMRLSPKDVDTEGIKKKIDELSEKIADVFKKYNAENLETLEALSESYRTAKSKADNAENKLRLLLNGEDYEELKKSAEGVEDEVRGLEIIKNDIKKLCGGNIDGFIAVKSKVINDYVKAYVNAEKLTELISVKKRELEEVMSYLSSVSDIPNEYLNISDPESELKRLENEHDRLKAARDEAFSAETYAKSKLETYRESLKDDPKEALEAAKRAYDEKLSLLKSWVHISEVFEQRRSALSDNPMKDISDKFSEYLGIISDKKVSTEFPDENKLNINIYSDNNLLSYDKLSEGTKDTVALAFRLAVLEHLFPNGDGIIVFDDPFTDMDKERREKACELVKKCAERHQIIFLTCDEEYIDVLGGKSVNL